MFEDSLVESRAIALSPHRRWIALASITLQIAIACMVIALPLLHPETLSFHVQSPGILLPLLPKPAPVVHMEHAAFTASSGTHVPVTQASSIRPSTVFSRTISIAGPPVTAIIGSGMASQGSLPAGLGDPGAISRPAVSVVTTPPDSKPVRISTGVSEGLLLTPIRPAYPAIAKSARIEGRVVVEALISKTGSIESLHVVSGPPMLQGAAMDAIRAARYRPYQLNGEPTAVQTTITVNFKISG